MESAVLLGAFFIVFVVIAYFPWGAMISALALFAAAVLLQGVSKGAIHEVGACVLLVGSVLCAACGGIARQLERVRDVLLRLESVSEFMARVQGAREEH